MKLTIALPEFQLTDIPLISIVSNFQLTEMN